MGQLISLPDGTILVVNGGANGTAGYAERTLTIPTYAQMPYGMSLASGPVGRPSICNPSHPDIPSPANSMSPATRQTTRATMPRSSPLPVQTRCKYPAIRSLPHTMSTDGSPPRPYKCTPRPRNPWTQSALPPRRYRAHAPIKSNTVYAFARPCENRSVVIPPPFLPPSSTHTASAPSTLFLTVTGSQSQWVTPNVARANTERPLVTCDFISP